MNALDRAASSIAVKLFGRVFNDLTLAEQVHCKDVANDAIKAFFSDPEVVKKLTRLW